MNSDYEAGNGEDKIFVVLREGRPPVNLRNRANALVMAREVTNEGGLVAVFNSLTMQFEVMSDYVDVPPEDKDAIAAGREELKALQARINQIKARLQDYRAREAKHQEREDALRVAAE